MSDAVVDVVIPTRNRVAMTIEAVDSVRGQTFHDWRVVLVDDASDDGSADALERHFADDARIQVVRRRQQGGPQAARQTGYEASNSPLVALLDSDDVWGPAKLERQMAALETDPAADVVLTWHEWILPDGGSRGVRKPYRDAGRGPLISTNMSTPLMRREALDRIGGMLPATGAHYRTCEGIEFYLRLSGVSRFAVVDELLVRCREHGGARTSDGFASRVAAEEMAEALSSQTSLLETMPRQRAHLSAQAAARFFAAGDFGAGSSWLRKALRVSDPVGSWRALRRFGPAIVRSILKRRSPDS